MADEAIDPTSTEISDEDLPGNNLAEESLDKELSRLFREASPDLDEIEEEKPKVETAPVDDSRLKALEEKIALQQEELIASRTRSDITLARALEKLNPQKAETISEPDEDAELEAFRDALQKDGAKAILKLLKNQGKKSTEEATSSATSAAANVVATRDALNADINRMRTTFGSFMENEAFNKRANEIYDEMVVDGILVDPKGTRWKRGAIYSAAAQAYAEFSLAGKIKPKVADIQARRKNPPDPMLGNRNDNDTSQLSEEEELMSLIPAHEMSIVRRTAKEMGMTLKEYAKIFKAYRKNDPGFGRA